MQVSALAPKTPGTSGPGSRKVLGFYDRVSLSWKTSPPIFGEGLTLSAQTLPAWGIASRGGLLELPTSERPTPGAASSLSPLLKTPNANLAVNGGSQHPAKRKAGGHGPTLADEVEWLLPTPKASDAHRGGMDPHELKRNNPNLSSIGMLLPTPMARDWKHGTGVTATNSRPLNEVVTLLPTPTATDSRGGRNATANRKPGSNHHSGTTLTDVFRAPPTGDAGESSPTPLPDGNPFAV
jgi:hypothetical protein